MLYGPIFATPRDGADVLLSNVAKFGTEEMLIKMPVRSPINGRSFVIPTDGNLLRRTMNPTERQN
jgi:hypothetical protein